MNFKRVIVKILRYDHLNSRHPQHHTDLAARPASPLIGSFRFTCSLPPILMQPTLPDVAAVVRHPNLSSLTLFATF
jgi:hypothetical protein